MPKPGFSRFWNQKSQEILKSADMPIAKKVLAYKIFLRPMLIYDWFEDEPRQLKMLEVKALRQIFGNCSEKNLYRKYTDIDVLSFMKLQGIRWKRATGSRIRNIRRMLHTLSSAADPSPYFAKANLCHSQRRRNRAPKPNSPKCVPKKGVRRSRRLAIKESRNDK